MHLILDMLNYNWYLASNCKLGSETEEIIKSLYTHLLVAHTGPVWQQQCRVQEISPERGHREEKTSTRVRILVNTPISWMEQDPGQGLERAVRKWKEKQNALWHRNHGRWQPKTHRRWVVILSPGAVPLQNVRWHEVGESRAQMHTLLLRSGHWEEGRAGMKSRIGDVCL